MTMADIVDELERARREALDAWLADGPADTDSSERLLRTYRSVAETSGRIMAGN